LEGDVDKDKNQELLMLGNKLDEISLAIHDAVAFCQGDPIAILTLLRQLESLHREIREEVFQKSLPDSRHGLYALLRDIEGKGGWPYIERMRIQGLLGNMIQDSDE
jgi:hypothetical protein